MSLPYLSRNPVPSPWFESTPMPGLHGPSPDPWLTHYGVSFLVSAVASKVAATAMTNKEAAEKVARAADSSISQFIDDYCGTPPRIPVWPFPGPPPWVREIASQLTVIAHTFAEGEMRTSLARLAGQLFDTIALNPQPLPPLKRDEAEINPQPLPPGRRSQTA